MRILHLGDLHIGKRVNEFSMLEDQRHLFDQVVRVIEDEQVDVVVIAGDVYDKSIPTVEATELFEDFLLRLARLDVPVIVTAGNHDSAERLSFGSPFMRTSGIYIARSFGPEPQHVTLEDDLGPVTFWLLPFVKPVYVRAAYPDAEIATYQDAVRVAVEHMPVDADARSVLVVHQFVTNAGTMPEVSDEASVVVGGVDHVDASLFAAFDYVALGHIHVAQQVGRPEVRYCGAPLAYSFSEARHAKTLTLVDLGAKGDAGCDVAIREVPVEPLHAMREVEGTLDELRERAAGEGLAAQDYLHVTLDDEQLMDAMAKVREFYPNTMELDFASAKRAVAQGGERAVDPRTRSTGQLFSGFYEAQKGAPLSDEQRALLSEVIGEQIEAPEPSCPAQDEEGDDAQ